MTKEKKEEFKNELFQWSNGDHALANADSERSLYYFSLCSTINNAAGKEGIMNRIRDFF